MMCTVLASMPIRIVFGTAQKLEIAKMMGGNNQCNIYLVYHVGRVLFIIGSYTLHFGLWDSSSHGRVRQCHNVCIALTSLV